MASAGMSSSAPENLPTNMDLFQSTYVLTTPTRSRLEQKNNDSVLKLIMALRGLDISAEFTFDFVLPEGCKEWPAPHYGPYSPHTEHPKPGGSLRLRKREATGLAKVGGKKAAKVQRQKERGFSRTRMGANGKGGQPPSSSSFHARESPLPIRSQPHIPDLEPLDAAPLTILSLPRELRDLIYSHLVLHPEPLTPQYRPCWKLLPGPNQRRRSHRVIRRSPPESSLALVSRQLRHETLSAFYGAGNTFLFQRSAEFLLRLEFNMLEPEWMGRWMSGCGRSLLPLVGNGGDEGSGSGGGGGGEGVSFLRNIELRFDDVRGATDTGSKMGPVTFSLSQTAGGGGNGAGIRIRHDLSTAFPRSCACPEDAMVEWITARSREGGAGSVGLVDVALKVCRWRDRDFGVGEGKVRRVRLGQARRGEGTRCERCGKVRVE